MWVLSYLDTNQNTPVVSRPLVFPFSSPGHSFRSGSFQVHSADSLLAFSVSNLVVEGGLREFSRTIPILTLYRFRRALGVIPIFLSEISPPAFRSTFAGVAYQLGIMASSPAAQIEAGACLSFNDRTVLTRTFRFIAIGEHLRTTIQGPSGPENVPNYAFIQGILIGCVAAYIIVLVFIGPDSHGRHFERSKAAFQVGASKEDIDSIPAEEEGTGYAEVSSVGSAGAKEKEVIQYVENKGAAGSNYV